MSDDLKIVTCECEQLRKSGPFVGWSDFDAFAALLERQTTFSQSPVGVPYSDVGLLEKWYECTDCHRVWRLVEPDPPFNGLWTLV
jgi:hypothetical protein